MKNKNMIGISPTTLVVEMILIFMSIGTAMATVWTDQVDYSPGSIVTISGDNSDNAGYQSGETVNVSVNGPYNYDSKCSGTTDVNGAWSCQITLSSDYTAEGNYTYTAVGQISKVTQSGTFTDSAANINFMTSGLQNGISVSVTWTKYVPSCNGKTANSNTNFMSPGPSTNEGTCPGSQFTYSFPAIISNGGVTYNLKTLSPHSPFTTGAAGSTTTVTATYELVDSTPPVINPTVSGTKGSNDWYTSDITLSWTVSDPESAISSSSGCGSTTINTDTSGTTLTCTATSAGGTSSQSVTIKRDTTSPLITITGDNPATVDAGSIYSDAGATATDDGTSVSVISSGSVDTTKVGIYTITYTAIDPAGNSVTATRIVNVVDTTPPTITVPTDMIVEATSASGAAVSFTEASASDLVDGSVATSCSPESGSIFPITVNTVTCSATDNAGNTGSKSFTVTVQDTTPPEITGVSDITAEATGPKTSPSLGIISATDIVDGPITVINDVPAGGFDVGDTTVTYTATDSHGNSASKTQKVTIIDTTPPTIVVPDDMTAEATGPTGVVVTFTVSASDLVDGSVTVICVPTSGSMFALETATVTCSATDVHSNAATKSFKVTVQDTTPPTIDAHTDITIEATSSSGAVVDYVSPTTYDIVDGSGTAGCTPISGSAFALGDTTVTCSATDTHGNKATDINFVVHVVDTTPPTINPQADIITEATGPTGATVSYTSPATHDAVDGDGVASCVPTSGSTFTLGDTTVKCDATDVHGNKAIQTTFKVTVQDTTPPTVTVPADIIAEATGPTGAAVTFTVTATDIVDGSVIPTCTPISGATFPLGNTLVICSATDTHSNTGSGSFSIKVQDTTPPVITVNGNNPATVMLGSSYTDAGATANDIVDGSFPAMATGTVDTTTVGTYTITYSATDKAGNTAVIQARTVKVIYQSGGTCYGNGGHQILQPINPDSSSVFKYGSTVPAKFRVCDAGGNSVGTPGVVSNFKLLDTTYGAGGIDENVVSTTPDTAFRWDSTSQQWIFNMNTKNLKPGYKYTYRISLNDGSNIDFIFGLK